eukprot:405540-Hanusia_phi.AAC.2
MWDERRRLSKKNAENEGEGGGEGADRKLPGPPSLVSKKEEPAATNSGAAPAGERMRGGGDRIRGLRGQIVSPLRRRKLEMIIQVPRECSKKRKELMEMSACKCRTGGQGARTGLTLRDLLPVHVRSSVPAAVLLPHVIT